jgi:hypothetical protein
MESSTAREGLTTCGSSYSFLKLAELNPALVRKSEEITIIDPVRTNINIRNLPQHLFNKIAPTRPPLEAIIVSIDESLSNVTAHKESMIRSSPKEPSLVQYRFRACSP